MPLIIIDFFSEREEEGTEESELLRTLLKHTQYTFLNTDNASVWASAPPSDVKGQARWLQSGKVREHCCWLLHDSSYHRDSSGEQIDVGEKCLDRNKKWWAEQRERPG